MPKAVGIDLGTTNSVVAVLEAGDPVVIPNAEGSRTTPSVVAFSKGGEVLMGEVAKRQAITNPDRTIRSVKRHMGTTWSIDIDGKAYTAQEISARTLQKLKRDAEAYLGDTVAQAVITVPAYFDDAQRTATKEAGQIAGLEVLRIINEPTAAALAYGLDKEGAEQTVLVFDLGGGTFDVSILEIGDGVFEVKATHGDTKLGGDDWDQRVIDWLVSQFKAAHGVDLGADNMALQRLKEAAEKAKIELSQVQQTQINLPFITATSEGPLHLDESLSRARFQELTADLIERCRSPFEQAIKDAGLSKEDLDHVILVGGSTRMPAVHELVHDLTGKEPHKGVNPDEVVAVGAAIQAGVLKGEVKDVLLLDVTPLSLGIETKGGVMTKLIERNTTIPTRRTEVFTTAEDMQPSVEIHVLQGEREMAQFNKTLGKFQLVDLPPAPRGVPQIEVTFDIDANGIVHVAAKDRATGKEQSMTITGQSSLAKDDIDKMVRDAEAHAEEDRRRREEAEVRNQADTLVYQTDKLLKEQGDKISGDEKSAVEDKLADLRTALGGTDIEAIRNATDALMSASQGFTQKLYEAASAESGGGRQPHRRRRGQRARGRRRRRRRDRRRRGPAMTDDTSSPAGDGAEPTAPDDVGDTPAEFVDQPDEAEATADAVAAGGADRGRTRRRRRRGRRVRRPGRRVRRPRGRGRRGRDRPGDAPVRARAVPRRLPAGAGRLRELPQAGPEAAGRRGRPLAGQLRRQPAAGARLVRRHAGARRVRGRAGPGRAVRRPQQGGPRAHRPQGLGVRPRGGRGGRARARRGWRAGGGRGPAPRLPVAGPGPAARHGQGDGLIQGRRSRVRDGAAA